MIELKGKFCKDLKIFTDNIEDGALNLLYELVKIFEKLNIWSIELNK